ncbi:MAG: hypothetical protein EOP10_09485 [Proteobacteria bacterium]|nr:MAG: hypothetical protein EOP10_09485 [Pseudomonadota bacterium]
MSGKIDLVETIDQTVDSHRKKRRFDYLRKLRSVQLEAWEMLDSALGQEKFWMTWKIKVRVFDISLVGIDSIEASWPEDVNECWSQLIEVKENRAELMRAFILILCDIQNPTRLDRAQDDDVAVQLLPSLKREMELLRNRAAYHLVARLPADHKAAMANLVLGQLRVYSRDDLSLDPFRYARSQGLCPMRPTMIWIAIAGAAAFEDLLCGQENWYAKELRKPNRDLTPWFDTSFAAPQDIYEYFQGAIAGFGVDMDFLCLLAGEIKIRTLQNDENDLG